MKYKTILFLEELAALLEKHKVEISADDEWNGYAECGQDIQIHFEMDHSYEEVKIGRWVDSETIRKTIAKG